MLGLFRNEKRTLEKKYARLLEESHKLSHTNRKQSDLKLVEANEVLRSIEELDRNDACHTSDRK